MCRDLIEYFLRRHRINQSRASCGLISRNARARHWSYAKDTSLARSWWIVALWLLFVINHCLLQGRATLCLRWFHAGLDVCVLVSGNVKERGRCPWSGEFRSVENNNSYKMYHYCHSHPVSSTKHHFNKQENYYQSVPLAIKGCICHFTKWQIHPFISKRIKGYLSVFTVQAVIKETQS